MLTAEFTGRNPGFGLAEDTDDLFVRKTLLHGNVLMWLMKTLLTAVYINQRGERPPTKAFKIGKLVNPTSAHNNKKQSI